MFKTCESFCKLSAVNIGVVSSASVMKNGIGVAGSEQHVQFLRKVSMLSVQQSDLYRQNKKLAEACYCTLCRLPPATCKADYANVTVLSFAL